MEEWGLLRRKASAMHISMAEDQPSQAWVLALGERRVNRLGWGEPESE